MSLPQDVCMEFKEQTAKAMEMLVWTDECRNSRNNHQIGGRLPTNWPGSTLHYLEAIREPRWDDWGIQCRGNRFAWMGNEVFRTEWDPIADLGYYIREHDDSYISADKMVNEEINIITARSMAKGLMVIETNEL
ncbi:hypothetical protein F4678DRAFT_459613 [Xylaria arbuscula]|nr:hypothetical protein F4678DRAFT_459613 [Xylaria arbuscula]